jgi:hypothetical protein
MEPEVRVYRHEAVGITCEMGEFREMNERGITRVDPNDQRGDGAGVVHVGLNIN